MARYTRHQLKEDKFQTFVSREVQLAGKHRKTILMGLAGLAVIVAVVAGAMVYINKRDDQASMALGAAIRTYTTPLQTPGAPEIPGEQSFTSVKDRSQAAMKEFTQVATSYPSTRNGKFARYLAGIAATEAGDSKVAEQDLSEAASYRDKDLSSLAKFALASIYRFSQRDPDAIRLYQELIEVNSETVPRATAQFELAALYEAKQQPAEAARIYEQIEKDEQANQPAADKKKPANAAPAQKSPIAELAENKLQQLKQAGIKK